MTTAIDTAMRPGRLAPGLRRRAATLGRHWSAALFAACTLCTLACLGWIAWQGVPAPPLKAAAAMPVPEGTDLPAAGWATSAPAVAPATATPAQPLRPIPESAWQRQRAEALAIERLNNEMMPLTPDVTPDQYVGAGDDLGPDAAMAQAGEPEEEGEEATSADD